MSDKKNSKDHGIGQYHNLDLEADVSEQLNDVYSNWADSYDDDNDHKLKTVSQPNTVALLMRHCADKSIRIFGVGVFTHGHLGPEGFPELIRITKPEGIICFTVNEGVWESGKFAEAIEEYSKAGKWEVLEMIKQDYMVNEGVQAWYVAARALQ